MITNTTAHIWKLIIVQSSRVGGAKNEFWPFFFSTYFFFFFLYSRKTNHPSPFCDAPPPTRHDLEFNFAVSILPRRLSIIIWLCHPLPPPTLQLTPQTNTSCIIIQITHSVATP